MQNAEAERTSGPDHFGADIPNADDAESFGAEPEVFPVGKFEHRGDDVFGDGIRIAAGGGGEADIVFGKIGHVHVIKTDGGGGDEFHAGTVEERGIDRSNGADE